MIAFINKDGSLAFNSHCQLNFNEECSAPFFGPGFGCGIQTAYPTLLYSLSAHIFSHSSSCIYLYAL